MGPHNAENCAAIATTLLFTSSQIKINIFCDPALKILVLALCLQELPSLTSCLLQARTFPVDVKLYFGSQMINVCDQALAEPDTALWASKVSAVKMPVQEQWVESHEL